MSLKLLSCLFVLTLAGIACAGDSRNVLRNSNYLDLLYLNQFYGGLSHPNSKPVPIAIPAADLLARNVQDVNDKNDEKNDDTEVLGEKILPGDIHTFIPVNSKGRDDLRPLLVSLRTELRHMVRSSNENKGILKNILSANQERLSWLTSEANNLYSLISSLTL